MNICCGVGIVGVVVLVVSVGVLFVLGLSVIVEGVVNVVSVSRMDWVVGWYMMVFGSGGCFCLR